MPFKRVQNEINQRVDPEKTRAELLKRNRLRAYRMEIEVSKLFVGDTRAKTRGSGSGDQKGDNWIELPNDSGYMIMECKTSEYTQNKQKGIRFAYFWFDKLRREAVAMNARLPVFVLKWVGSGFMLALFEEKDWDTICAIGGLDAKAYTFNSPPVAGVSKSKGKPQASKILWLRDVEAEMERVGALGEIPHIRFSIPGSMLIGVDIKKLKMLLGYDAQ